MPSIVCNLSALAVASLFYCWRAYHTDQLRRGRTLRQRVAYMLWVVANTVV